MLCLTHILVHLEKDYVYMPKNKRKSQFNTRCKENTLEIQLRVSAECQTLAISKVKYEDIILIMCHM